MGQRPRATRQRRHLSRRLGAPATVDRRRHRQHRPAAFRPAQRNGPSRARRWPGPLQGPERRPRVGHRNAVRPVGAGAAGALRRGVQLPGCRQRAENRPMRNRFRPGCSAGRRTDRAGRPRRRATQGRRELPVGQAQRLVAALLRHVGPGSPAGGRVRFPIAARSRPAEAKAARRCSSAAPTFTGSRSARPNSRSTWPRACCRPTRWKSTCNQGRLGLQPELCLDRQPMEFRLSAGTLASRIQLDQAACRSALKYVVPVLASVTQSEGQFSIQLDGCRIPIGDLSHAEIAGRIIVHSATMNPGPLVRAVGLAGGGVSLAGSHRARVGDPLPHDRRADLSPGAGAAVPGRHDADLRLGRAWTSR